MIDDGRELARIRNVVLLLSALAWMWLLIEPGAMMIHAHSPPMGPEARLGSLLAMNPPASLAAGWLLMLAAMMPPALIPPLGHVRQSSFKRRRARSMALFAAGYAAVWMAPGGLLPAAALLIHWFAPRSIIPAAAIALAALVWQLSPVKQRCLNRCHSLRELAAFGAAADLAALRFGITQGIWCAGSCWALMLFPLLLQRGHLAAMAAVSLLVFSERLEEPMPPRWRWRGFGRVRRLVFAQALIRLHAR